MGERQQNERTPYGSFPGSYSVVLLALCASVVNFCSGCGGLPDQHGSSIGDVAGDVSQQIEQVSGLEPAMIAKLAVCGGAWIIGLALIGWLLPNPRSWWLRGLFIGLIVFAFIGVPLVLFGG